MTTQFIEDLSPIGGIYSDYIYLKENALVSIINIKGINFDLLSAHQQTFLFEEYGAFLAQNAHYNMQLVSMTMPIKINEYLRKWKQEYVRSINDDSTTENLKQLRASYLYDFQSKETNLEMNQKQHFIILKEKIKNKSIENLKIAEKKLREKTEEIRRGLNSFLEQFDSEQEVVSAFESLKILNKFLDYRMSAYEGCF